MTKKEVVHPEKSQKSASSEQDLARLWKHRRRAILAGICLLALYFMFSLPDAHEESQQTQLSEEVLTERLNTLNQRLTHKDPWAIYRALLDLGELGEQAADSVSKIEPFVEHDDRYVRFAAAKALGQIGGTAHSAVPLLAKALDDEDSNVRSMARTALEHIGTEDAIAILQQTSNDENNTSLSP